MALNRYRGLFKAAPTPSPLPNRFDINDGQSWLHAVAQASGRHRVVRIQGEGSPTTADDEGGSWLSVQPAGTEDELLEQVASLNDAFEATYGRSPTDDDAVFWEAVNAVRAAYTGPSLDRDAVAGALS